MLILVFAAVCIAGVAFLFRELKDSDRATAEKLRISSEAGMISTSENPKP